MRIQRCFACARHQHDQALVYFGPGEFIKCHACGVWQATEWATGEAEIQAYVARSPSVARWANTTTQVAAVVIESAATLESASALVRRVRAPRFSYPLPISLRA